MEFNINNLAEFKYISLESLDAAINDAITIIKNSTGKPPDLKTYTNIVEKSCNMRANINSKCSLQAWTIFDDEAKETIRNYISKYDELCSTESSGLPKLRKIK